MKESVEKRAREGNKTYRTAAWFVEQGMNILTGTDCSDQMFCGDLIETMRGHYQKMEKSLDSKTTIDTLRIEGMKFYYPEDL